MAGKINRFDNRYLAMGFSNDQNMVSVTPSRWKIEPSNMLWFHVEPDEFYQTKKPDKSFSILSFYLSLV